MSKVVEHNDRSFFWVGGTDQEQEGDWKWTDGSDWDFEKWATIPTQQPNDFQGQDCLQIYDYNSARDGWNDATCAKKKSFVCSQKVCQDDIVTNNTENSNNNNTSNGRNKITDNIYRICET